MYGSCFEEMVIDFVVICDGTDEVCCDVTLVVERLESTIDAQVFALFWRWLDGRGVSVAVIPLLDFDEAGTVVDFEGCVCGLCLYRVDLADEC